MSSASSSSSTSATSSGDDPSSTFDSSVSSLVSAISSTIGSLSSDIVSATSTPSETPASTSKETDDNDAQASEGISLETFIASLAVSAIVFGVQVFAFVLIRKKLARVYQPRTYLVPERKRTPAPPNGFINWFKPIFNTATSDFIAKSGLDAYFFLRYLLVLLKTFAMIALIGVPILLPMNYVGGRSGDDVEGMDRFAWGNVATSQTRRYWAHLLLAVILVFTFCYTMYDELRKYIRMRQMYLTSPQHRLKASATTVLVSGIPKSWLTVQRLVELYDVFPGGIRNVWINRDFGPLQEKVDERDELAKQLESAETELIQMARKNHEKKLKKEAKANPTKKVLPGADEDSEAPIGPGLSSGDPHQLDDLPGHSDKRKSKSFGPDGKKRINIPGVGAGFERVEHGVREGVMGGIGAVTGGFKKITGGFDRHFQEADGFGESVEDTHPALRSQQPQAPPLNRGQSHDSHGKRGSTLINSDGQSLVIERTRSSLQGGSIPPTIETSAAKHHFWQKRDKKVGDAHKRGSSDETPLSHQTPTSPNALATFGNTALNNIQKPISAVEKVLFGQRKHVEYGPAYNTDFDGEAWGEPVWKKYVLEKDRPTMNLPVGFMPFSLPFIGNKVDTISHCRKELARLNLEIEQDQEHVEDYPLMNSAFIQFNQQIAAHMACQSLSHHVPQHMCPRHIEVSPNDVIWGNMRMQWWERYIRSAGITAATIGLVFGWALPVGFVATLSQISYLQSISWLAWIGDLPENVLGIVSGVLPPLFLGILMAILPMILRAFARLQGAHTGMEIERKVQAMYFTFLFVQLFLVVSIAASITAVAGEIFKDPTSTPQILAKNIPKASNFFFSYLLLQAFSLSSGALLQIATLAINFLLAPIIDKTARQRFTRATTLQEIKWGTFYPVYTNLACIGIVYSVISPLILIFNCIAFSLFWVVYRYNLLFVVNFKFDTGGLLFPRALNQLFTGLYVMEICLIGLFFLVRDAQGRVACFPQAIIMIVVGVLTILFQFTLNKAFDPVSTHPHTHLHSLVLITTATAFDISSHHPRRRRRPRRRSLRQTPRRKPPQKPAHP